MKKGVSALAYFIGIYKLTRDRCQVRMCVCVCVFIQESHFSKFSAHFSEIRYMNMQNATDNNEPPEYVAEITNMSCNPIYIVIDILFPATKITDLMK